MPLFWTVIILLCVVVVEHTNSTVNDNDDTIDLVELHRSLRFDPPEIDFGTWSIGVARSQKVTLVNENANRSVYLSSVSGRTPIFYSSFFESRVLPPLANTTFEVVFLPRKSAISSDYLLVHTSFGQARLLVRGEGFECPYRLQPIVGIKAPLNALLTPEIYLYNPHSRPLQIVEVYSSGGQFQLELPSGLATAPQALWEIPPHTTKPVIRIKFEGDSAGNHTAYIRIKIAPHSDDDDVPLSQISGENVLVVPVEFEITPEEGMYAANPVLDFGRIINMKQKKPLQLNMQLRNSNKLRTLEKIGLADGESLITGLRLGENDGILTLDAHIFNKTTSLDEILTLQAKADDNKAIGPKFTIRVRAQIFKGSLNYNRNTTVFITGAVRCKEGETRILNFRNDFEIPLSILSVNIARNDSQAIQVHLAADYRNGLTLQPEQSFDLATLQLMNTSVQYQTELRLMTNITNFEVPIVICSGRLHVMTFNEPVLIPGEESFSNELNMGTVPLSEMSQPGYIAFYNPNPIVVKLTNWNFKSPKGVYFHTTSMGCLRPPLLQLYHSNKSVNIESSSFRFCSQLGEGDILVFQIAIQSHITELSSATLQIWTPYENIITTLIFHTWIGKLEVDQEHLYFKDCYPGKLCTAELSIYSTFQHPIHITSINFTNSAIRFENEYSKNLIFALTPNAATRLGRIFFEPALHCSNRCYLPLDDKQNSLAFPSHLVNENNNYLFDETELRRRTELYRQMKWYYRDMTFIVRSRELRQMHLQAFIDIEWPKLVNAGKYKFPNTEAGKVQEMIVVIKNPTENPLLVDYYLSDPNYAQQTKLSLPLEVVSISSSCYLTDKHVFSIPKQRGSINDGPILLPPYGSKEVLVRFEAPAHQRETFCTLLHIRNNLTLYEAVWLSARVVQSQFRFGNRKPGSSTQLLYDLQDKHLSACPAPVIAKRTFTARNTGEVPIWIDTFLIDNQECEGYGFKVYGGCGKGFELRTNQSRKIEIAFRPDFTASRTTRLLTIRTNLSYTINYTLHAQLPPTSLLVPCTEGIQRPFWEDRARFAGLFLLLTSFVLVVAAAHIDSESISQTQSALYVAREKGPVHPTFNLRNIAVKATSSLSSSNSTVNNSNSNGRFSNKNNNHYMQAKSVNLSQQKKRAVTSSAGGGNNVKKYQLNTSPTVRNIPCIDPFCVSDHIDTSTLSMPKTTATCNEECSKPVQNRDIVHLTPTNATIRAESNEPAASIAPISKTATPTVNRVDWKKQKTPPLQASSIQSSAAKPNKIYTKGKPRIMQQMQFTPPPAQNPIIELMDKEVALCDAAMKEEKYLDTSPKATEKRALDLKIEFSLNTPSAGIVNVTSTTTRPSAVITTIPKIIAASPNTTAVFPSKLLAPSSSLSKSTKAVSSAPSIANRTTPPVASMSPSIIKSSPQVLTPESNPEIPSTDAISDIYPPIRKGHQSLNKKYGKTTGRERRKEKKESYEHRATNTTTISAASSSSSLASTSAASSTTTKRSERKPDKKLVDSKTVHVQTLEENKRASPIKNDKIQQPKPTASTANNISSLFEVTGTQKVSLNDILEVANKNEMPTSIGTKSTSTNTTPVSSDYQSPLDKAMRHIDPKEKNKPFSKSVPLSEPILNDQSIHQSFESCNKVADLGPIGSKKSPSSTPVWEAFGANCSNSIPIVRSAPLQPKPTDSNSFFSSFMDTSEHNFDYNNATAPFIDGISTTDLYELRKAQAELRRQLSANEYLLKIRQQQLKEQLRRQQKHQQDMLQSITTHWPAQEDTAWPSIAFDAHRSTSVALGENNNNGKGVTTNSGVIENLTKHWQTSSPVRPPPGMGVATTSSGFLNGITQHSQQALAHNNNNCFTNNTQNNAAQKESEEARVFDPFSSLSSIWSDSWKQQMTKKDDIGNNQGQGYGQP